ncbi:hypothetical protein DZK27_14365 [Rhodobacteraceae bacterium 63075]|nr:hypothetical protein DZK27_14365 [Rhodobacteraceae bacterium 63075]
MTKPPMKPWQIRARVGQIHALAEENLAAQSLSSREGHALLEELVSFGAEKKKPRTLEAMIMVCAGCRIRPKRTRKFLTRLRTMRKRAGEMAAFEAFEAKLAAQLGGDAIVTHSFGAQTFRSMDHAAVWAHVQELIAQITGGEDRVFLNSGTLLGVVRDGRLIDHDDDIDLAYRLEARSAAEAASEWRALNARLVAEGLAEADYQIDTGMMKLDGGGVVRVDLFPVWLDAADRVYVFPHTFGELEESQVFPTHSCTVTGLPVPAEPEAMLAINYGKDWREPDPYYAFPWFEAKKRFADYLGAIA